MPASIMTQPNPGESPCVAVIDDDIRFIRYVERLLSVSGVTVSPITTDDLEQTAQVMSDAHCSAALVDVFMYDQVHGFAAVESLREDPRTAHVPLIISSADHREVARATKRIEHQGCSVLLKPFEPEELLEMLVSVNPEAFAAPIIQFDDRNHVLASGTYSHSRI